MMASPKRRHSVDGSPLASPLSKESFDASKEEDSDQEPELYQEDDFRMFCMKVLPCSKRYCHDWVTCPFTHTGEKARRRDPRAFSYTGIACPDMKSKDNSCARGDHCPYAHNVFEYWLHPTRYRTQLCNDGTKCERRVCFFAHSLEELRVPIDKPAVLPEQLASGTVTSEKKAGFETGPHKGGSLPSGFPARHQQDDLAAQLAALQMQGGGKFQQDDATLMQLLREVLGNQLQGGQVVESSTPYSAPFSNADTLFRSSSDPMGWQNRQLQGMQETSSGLLGGMMFPQDELLAQQYFAGRQQPEPQQQQQAFGQFGVRGSVSNVFQQSSLYGPTELPRNFAASRALDRLQEGVPYEYSQATAQPSFRRTGRRHPGRRGGSLDLNPSGSKLPPLSQGGSSYAFLSGGQRGEASGPIVDHSLRRGSDESSRASSEYPRSSFEYQRSSFESARSPPMNYDAQRKLSTMLGGASLFDGTLFQPEADLGSSSGRPSLDVQASAPYSFGPGDMAAMNEAVLSQQQQQQQAAKQYAFDRSAEEELLNSFMLRQHEMAADPNY